MKKEAEDIRGMAKTMRKAADAADKMADIVENGQLTDEEQEDQLETATSERFFECPSCGAHYTVTVIDREMRLMIQKRSQLMKKVSRMLRAGGSKEQVQKLLDADKKLKENLKSRADRLKEEYAEVIG